MGRLWITKPESCILWPQEEGDRLRILVCGGLDALGWDLIDFKKGAS